MRKRITYRPSKAQALFSAAMGAIFVIIGLTVVIPTVGPFGILWTIFAIAITGMNLGHAFGKSAFTPQINIEEEDTVAAAQNIKSAEQRMKQLRSLYDQRLITPEEYEQKRQDILKEL